MIRLIIRRVSTCPEGTITGIEFRTVDVEDAVLQRALTPEHGYVGVQLLGAEVVPSIDAAGQPESASSAGEKP